MSRGWFAAFVQYGKELAIVCAGAQEYLAFRVDDFAREVKRIRIDARFARRLRTERFRGAAEALVAWQLDEGPKRIDLLRRKVLGLARHYPALFGRPGVGMIGHIFIWRCHLGVFVHRIVSMRRTLERRALLQNVVAEWHGKHMLIQHDQQDKIEEENPI